jgi:hypothetical protein
MMDKVYIVDKMENNPTPIMVTLLGQLVRGPHISIMREPS